MQIKTSWTLLLPMLIGVTLHSRAQTKFQDSNQTPKARAAELVSRMTWLPCAIATRHQLDAKVTEEHGRCWRLGVAVEAACTSRARRYSGCCQAVGFGNSVCWAQCATRGRGVEDRDSWFHVGLSKNSNLTSD
jgi:hypothetical protein